MAKHLLSVRKYNKAKSCYEDFRTEWLSEADALRVLSFMQKNAQVRFFYKYTLTAPDGKKTVHETLCADLLQYAQHQAKTKASIIPKTLIHA